MPFAFAKANCQARENHTRQLRDGENVFSLLDLDGNGELELEEFRLAFTGLAAP